MFTESRKSKNVTRPISKGITFSEAMANMKDAEWYRITKNTDNFRKSLAIGYPIVLGFGVNQEMKDWQLSDPQMELSKFCMPRFGPNEKVIGFHCVLIVGYDDDYEGGIFIARNSWGTEWGNNGHFYIPYRNVNNSKFNIDAMVVDLKDDDK